MIRYESLILLLLLFFFFFFFFKHIQSISHNPDARRGARPPEPDVDLDEDPEEPHDVEKEEEEKPSSSSSLIVLVVISSSSTHYPPVSTAGVCDPWYSDP
jgi:hypothetical protein